jgi:hypothetical protein
MVKEYFLTYRHVNGHIIRKQLTELDLEEVYESPFVEQVIALTPIDFKNFDKSMEEHKTKEQKYLDQFL